MDRWTKGRISAVRIRSNVTAEAAEAAEAAAAASMGANNRESGFCRS